MRPDAQYIKGLLTAFQDSPEPTITIDELKLLGFSHETKEFYFHIRLFHDQGFVERDDEKEGLGTIRVGYDDVQWYVVPLRLTASGHEFAEALNSQAGWQAVKKSAISTSLSMMKDLAVAAFKAEMMGHLPH